MPDFNAFAKTVGDMPGGALIAIVILAGFALAGYAIYAVMSITKGRR